MKAGKAFADGVHDMVEVQLNGGNKRRDRRVMSPWVCCVLAKIHVIIAFLIGCPVCRKMCCSNSIGNFWMMASFMR